MLPVPWQMKIATLAGGARISLLSVACSGGDDSAKTAGPTATTRATATPTGAGSAGAVDACSALTSAEISAAIDETEGGALSHV